MNFTVRWVRRWNPSMMRGFLRPVFRTRAVRPVRIFSWRFSSGGIPDAGFGQFRFVVHHQVMQEAEEDGLGHLGGDAAGGGDGFIAEDAFADGAGEGHQTDPGPVP